ncbi:transporter substrate-binding domain-containing protein [Cytobacillus purgationiresistens]|uniref:Polar amino acid transport system substrate-binding protein n=1 Tax=Cytobacillus purgationiresistens TaxID=863449 RepID=A0ABU0AN48_9BACI|nr:transporter substrate-binding domain-containing protein [Cytobacillus purgationiresistens]MDQ0272701.1 polar amino acid transport system substrate-binding protein [Cytobacillus purgationiresistens]
MNRLVMLSGLLGVLFFFLVGCGSQTSGNGENGGSTNVSIAALNNYPPLIFKQNGQLTGFEYDILQAIGKEENIDTEFKEMKFDGFIPGIQSNQVDIASSLLIREERKEVVDFSEVFLESGLVLVVPVDSTIQSLEDLKGKRIVATQGSTTLEKAKELAGKYGGEAKPLKETDALYLDVENGNSDALILNSPTVDYRLTLDGKDTKFKIVGEHLTVDEHAFAVKKGNIELLGKINSGLKTIKENGEYEKIYIEWFGK